MRVKVLGCVLLAIAVSGCLSSEPTTTDEDDPVGDGLTAITQVRDRHKLNFTTEGTWSQVLEKGLFDVLPALDVYVNFAVPMGGGVPNADVNIGVFLPNVPAGTKVPVVADIGPYYYDLDDGATTPAHRLGKFLIENLVQHGYAVAQVSVTGTGRSGSCMDLMGGIEQAGIHAAVDWLAGQEWSNGNIGVIGRSYDGSTVWEAVMDGNEHVKTVVPISGLYGQHDLMWRNGSAELRGPGLLWFIYWTFTFTATDPLNDDLTDYDPVLGLVDPDQFIPSAEEAPSHAQRVAEGVVCPETQTGAAQAVAAYANGGPLAPGVNTYFSDRSFREEVLANYKGSVYFIHGLQDWNVDNHMAFPFYGELQAKGLDMKGLFGQWAHMYPDRPGEHANLPDGYGKQAYPESVRWDWAQDLREWFDYYLKGTGAKPELHVEVQDRDGQWRIEETYPPRDANWTVLDFGTDLKLKSGSGSMVSEFHTVTLEAAPLADDLRIAGMSQLHVTVTPRGPGGQIFAELQDLDAEGERLGHAVMDLRLAGGGQTPKPVVPGVPIVAKMEFFAMDALVPAGHRLALVLTGSGEDYLPSIISTPVDIDVSGKSVLRLPGVERGADAFFTPPQGGEAAATNQEP